MLVLAVVPPSAQPAQSAPVSAEVPGDPPAPSALTPSTTDTDPVQSPAVVEAYQEWASARRTPTDSAAERLRVEIETQPDSAAAVAGRVAELGAKSIELVASSLLEAEVPLSALPELATDSAVIRIGLPTAVFADPIPVEAVGSRGGEIVTKTNASAWQAVGYSGAGVKIGVVDIFDGATWNQAVAAGEISSSALRGTFCRVSGTDCNLWGGGSSGNHGVAVAETLSDMAPGVGLYLASVGSLADLKAAIDYFAANGVRIVSRSLGGRYDGPGNGTGPSAEVLEYAVGKGIAWFNSAGNHGIWKSSGRRVGGYWRQGWIDSGGDGWLDFVDPTGGVASSHFLPVTCGWVGGLRWNDWGEGSGATDYDLYAFTSTGTLLASSVNDQQAGRNPVEGTDAVTTSGATAFDQINCSANPYIYLAIHRAAVGTTSAGDILEIQVDRGLWDYPSLAGSAGQPFADTRSLGGAAVGAVDPVNGTEIAYYSSRGPSNDGRIKPDLSAGAGFGSLSIPAGFNGTSAATPAVAGAAALVLQAAPSITPAQLVAYLKQSVVDRGAAGADNVYGTGELRLPNFNLATSTPKISGKPRVGEVLTALPGSWTAKTKFSYQWLRDGKVIAGATSLLRVLSAADRGHRMSVRVTGKRAGFNSVTKTSAQTAVVGIGKLATGVVRISGTPAAGQKVSANPGSWTNGTSFSYRWRLNGKTVKGATKRTFTIPRSAAGKRVSVVVTGRRSGYASASVASKATAKLLRASVPKLTGTPKPGRTLKATKGKWSTKVEFGYRWLRNGKAIAGATRSSYRLTKKDVGKRITVRLTGKRAGYATVSLVSKPTRTVKK